MTGDERMRFRSNEGASSLSLFDSEHRTQPKLTLVPAQNS